MKLNNRRGISSIIGTMFVVMLTVAALATTVSVVQQQQQATTKVVQETDQLLDSLSEKIEISQTRINNDKLNLTLTNTGDSTARVKSIYIINETASPKEQYQYDVDYLIDGRTDVANIGQELSFVASNITSYSVRVITESGNSDSSVYYPFILTPIPLSLSVIPPVVTTGENVSLLYTITNNLTSLEPLTVSPTISHSVACDGSQICTVTKLTSGPSEVVIEKGSFVIIKESYKIDGPPGTIVTFNASFAEAETGNFVIEDAKVVVVSSTFDVNNAVATAPDIYLTIPSPFGDSDSGFGDDNGELGLWGVAVVNPTAGTMSVSRVLITIFTAAHAGDAVIFSSSSSDHCSANPVTPASNWDCPHNNQIQWKDLSSPITLAAGESRSFMVRVEPAALGSSEDPGATVTATVYTDIGIFTKTGYTTAMKRSNSVIANVYLTDTNANGGSSALSESHMLGNMSNINPGTNTTFYVAVADFDKSDISGGGDTRIMSNAKLIINVPPGFANVTAADTNAGFVFNATETVRADGVTQIVAVTSESIGNNGDEARVLQFFAIAPSPNEDTTYIMYAFIDGETNSSASSAKFSVGALAEIPLQVNGIN